MTVRTFKNDGYERGSYMLKLLEDGKQVGFRGFGVNFGVVHWGAPDEVMGAQWKAACKVAQKNRREAARDWVNGTYLGEEV